ncbi:hypothetical protein E2C01_052705 [Portunus trituberculatus]|uniref:Uncharacterized protein n=1 Tax=Portunus trituberculatus TaxID=210409 RepID=A0A5B7GNZ2_PORTR|nr:hypothetical protein [Portunus trituberculatus]
MAGRLRVSSRQSRSGVKDTRGTEGKRDHHQHIPGAALSPSASDLLVKSQRLKATLHIFHHTPRLPPRLASPRTAAKHTKHTLALTPHF